MYDCTIANSFDGDYEMYYGSDAAVMLRESRAWMFKEVDSPLFDWEVYAKKERIFKEAGIVLVIGGSKQANLDQKPAPEISYTSATLSAALENFLRNSVDLSAAEERFVADYGADDPNALLAELAKINRRPAGGFLEGFQAAVTAIKANEAILSGSKLVFKPEWYELG